MSDKKATTIEEQIDILKSRGIIIENEAYAKVVLFDIGYFRIGSYSFPFEVTYPQKINRTHKFKANTKFDDIVNLYFFDVELRHIFLRYLALIEVNFKTKIIYIVSNHFKDYNTWFINTDVVTEKYISAFDKEVYTDKFKLNKVIKNHHKMYISDKYAPAWKTIEFMTLGSVIKLYNALKDSAVKQNVSLIYGINTPSILNSYLETIRDIRNLSAHGSVMYDLRLSKGIAKGPGLILANEGQKTNLCGATHIIEYFLKYISEQIAEDFKNDIEKILIKYKKNKELNTIISTCSGYDFCK